MMDQFMNWRDEDNKFLDIDVMNPRTHIKDGKALYTDYEIHVKTNHPEFAIKDLLIRRRYSEFVWLKNKLGINDIMMTTPPSLPGKKIIGRFKDSFLKERQLGLQNFMNKVVEINAFLSDPALHLFLQTDLAIEHMEMYLQHGGLLSNVRDKVILFQKNRQQRQKHKEVEENKFNNFRISISKRAMSLESLNTLRDFPIRDGENGRGWSQFIGSSICTWEVSKDRDVTDYDVRGGEYSIRQNNIPTACVLPGGQLCLPDDASASSASPAPRARSQSWHGNTSDIIDLLLDSYDVITPAEKRKETLNEVDSMTFSHESRASDSGTNNSSDNDVDVDFNKKISEYTIINVPSNGRTNPTLPTVSELQRDLFHHSLSASYNDYKS